MKSLKPQFPSLNNPEISRHALSSAPSVKSVRSVRSVPVRGSAAALAAACLALTGCKATETWAAGITTKNVSGNGTVVDSRIGIDPDTKIPALKTVFISGDFATVKAGTNQVSYREESSASVWNASSVTKKRFLAITLADSGDIPAAIKAVAEVFKEAEKTAGDK